METSDDQNNACKDSSCKVFEISRECKENGYASVSYSWNDSSCGEDYEKIEEDSECAESVCGNGVVEKEEQCDDGNANDQDSCSNTCQIKEESREINSGTIVIPADPLKIFDEASVDIKPNAATVKWRTNRLSTSRIVYDSKQGIFDPANPPNYGYAYSTTEDTNKTIEHSVTIYGLSEKTTYYYRSISSASLPVVGSEYSFTTTEKNQGSKDSDKNNEEKKPNKSAVEKKETHTPKKKEEIIPDNTAQKIEVDNKTNAEINIYKEKESEEKTSNFLVINRNNSNQTENFHSLAVKQETELGKEDIPKKEADTSKAETAEEGTALEKTSEQDNKNHWTKKEEIFLGNRKIAGIFLSWWLCLAAVIVAVTIITHRWVKRKK